MSKSAHLLDILLYFEHRFDKLFVFRKERHMERYHAVNLRKQSKDIPSWKQTIEYYCRLFMNVYLCVNLIILALKFCFLHNLWFMYAEPKTQTQAPVPSLLRAQISQICCPRWILAQRKRMFYVKTWCAPFYGRYVNVFVEEKICSERFAPLSVKIGWEGRNEGDVNCSFSFSYSPS